MYINCILMFVGHTHTHTTYHTPLHIPVSSPTSYTDIVQANDRLLSALKCFFQFECPLNESLCILLLVSTQSHILWQSLPTHSAVIVQLLSVLLCPKETSFDLLSL